MKPTLLSAPEGGKADDLKRVKGIGKVLEKNLHAMGIYHYEQLAELTPDNISWLTDYVSFPEGRIDDENWTGQAKALAEGKQTEYSQRFDKGDTPYK
jgi:NADH-quinone oxidoreductase subunit E